MTNNDPRDIAIPLDFLEDGLSYRARILSDAPDADANSESVTLEEQTVTR